LPQLICRYPRSLPTAWDKSLEINFMENFLGNLVLIPQQGNSAENLFRIGAIQQIDHNTRRASIAFSDLSVLEMPFEKVLLLKNPAELYRYILQNAKDISSTDFKVLLRVNMLQESVGTDQLISATAMLANSPSAALQATRSLDEHCAILRPSDEFKR